jgi:hypothetical protein
MPTWISIEESLPEPRTVVLVLCDDGVERVGELAYYADGERYIKALGTSSQVTRWRPLEGPVP